VSKKSGITEAERLPDMDKDKVGVAIIGCGRMGTIHAELVSKCPEARLVAVADRHAKTARALAERYNGCKATIKSTDILQSQDVQAVIIALPSNNRKRPVVSALRAGKHVLVEKPFALTLRDADAMISEATSSAKILMSGQVLRYAEAHQTARRMTQAGEAGEVLQVVHQRLDLIREPFVSWWENAKLKTGFAIHHHGSHTIDLILWMLDTEATSVFASSSCCPGHEYEDTASILLNTEAGASVAITESFRSRKAVHSLLIIGSKATLEIRDASSLLVDGQAVRIKDTNEFQRQMDSFVRAAKRNRYPAEGTLESVRKGIAAMEAAIKSCRLGKSVAVRN